MTDPTQALIEAHMDIPRQEARRWRHTPLEQDDLISEGYIGLVKAARRYRPELGEFAPFARIRVRGCITDAVAAHARRNRTADGYARTFPLDAPPADGERPFELADRGAGVEEQVVARDTLRQVAALPPREAEALLRHAVLGDTLSEIGADMGLSETGVSKMAARGAARLRQAAA